jgi:DNA ligase-1
VKRFARFIAEVDSSTGTNDKVRALASYFEDATDEDKIWVIALLSGRRPRRPVTSTQIREWAIEASGIPQWLFEESYQMVGDLAETISLLVDRTLDEEPETLDFYMQRLIELKSKNDEEKKEFILSTWRTLTAEERFAFNKFLTGGFRIGISQKLMTRALSKVTGIEESQLSHRLMGNWVPQKVTYAGLILEPDSNESESRPYPFYLAYPLEQEPHTLGPSHEWIAEYKWDGIRGQLVKRGGNIYIWSRGEELVTSTYPEFQEVSGLIPNGVVMDGELLAYRNGEPLSFNHMQKRIGRKKPSAKIISENPVVLMAYDVMEWKGIDLRKETFIERRRIMEDIVRSIGHHAILSSPIVAFDEWEKLRSLRDNARDKKAEGLMLKHTLSTYKVGRKRGDWWKWKVEPLTIDGILLYAQPGHGRRSNLFTDYTFAVWKGDELVPFTKAYSGLKDEEFREITRYVRQHTIDRFGPVRAVRPNLVFEIAFEGIHKSNRHKSGIALRFPRMKRWRKDKHPKEANSLDDLHKMLKIYG